MATAVAATLFHVLGNDTIYGKLKEEVRNTFLSRQSICAGTSLDSCVYLRACVEESLRIAPPGPGIFWRRSEHDMEVDGVQIRAGTEVGVSIYALHHNRDVFLDPESFEPDRFLSPNATRGFIPFLSGFRSCPAQKLAYPMVCLPIARLVWEFDLERINHSTSICQETDAFEQIDVFGSKVKGPMVRFRPTSR